MTATTRRLVSLAVVLLLAAACAAGSGSMATGERYTGSVVDRWPAVPENGGRWIIAVHAGDSLFTIEVTPEDWLWLQPGLPVLLTKLHNGRWVISEDAPHRNKEREGDRRMSDLLSFKPRGDVHSDFEALEDEIRSLANDLFTVAKTLGRVVARLESLERRIATENVSGELS